MRAVWITIGVLALVVGVVGFWLPLLPTVPFLLLAAFAFARSSKRLHRWLLEHPALGPPIVAWNERGAIGIRAKWFSTASILASAWLGYAFDLSPLVYGIQLASLVGVLLFIWTRPSA